MDLFPCAFPLYGGLCFPKYSLREGILLNQASALKPPFPSTGRAGILHFYILNTKETKHFLNISGFLTPDNGKESPAELPHTRMDFPCTATGIPTPGTLLSP